MKSRRNLRIGTLAKTALVAFVLGAWSMPAWAQGGGGGGGGAGGGALGGGGGGGAAGAGRQGGGMGGGGGSAGGGLVLGSGSGGGGGTGTGQSPINKSNPFGPYYSSPVMAGLAANVQLKSQTGVNLNATSNTGGATNQATAILTKAGTFGVPLYANANKTTTATAGGGGTSSTATGFSTQGVRRLPQYVTVPDFEGTPRMPVVQMKPQLQAALQNGALKTGQNLSVSLDGQTFVLRGTVGTEKERRLAEGLIRLEPGVYDVRNEIVVNGGGSKAP